MGWDGAAVGASELGEAAVGDDGERCAQLEGVWLSLGGLLPGGADADYGSASILEGVAHGGLVGRDVDWLRALLRKD